MHWLKIESMGSIDGLTFFLHVTEECFTYYNSFVYKTAKRKCFIFHLPLFLPGVSLVFWPIFNLISTDRYPERYDEDRRIKNKVVTTYMPGA